MKRMLFNATQAEELRVAIVDGQKLVDLDIETTGKEQRKSNIYKGVITRIEPSLEAAFVDYGAERHGFLPFKEISRSYFSNPDADPARVRIQDALKEGKQLIVQVDKDERGTKGAALTTFISLAGRYLVLMPNNPRGGGVSRRIEGEERNEVRDAIAQLDVPSGMSTIARTAGIGRSVEELQWDLSYLLQLWRAIDNAASQQSGAFLIYQDASLVIRAIRDYFHEDIGELLIDTDSIFEQAHQFMGHVMPQNVSRVKLYKDDVPLFSRFQIEHQIETAYSRQVSLPSGGSVVIDHTEALVSIDVNSARATKGSDIEETALRTNLEASDEIARQLRLRDLGGLVVIDYIDMEYGKNQREVETRLRDALRYDRARVQTGKISRFGLLELSRQRLQTSLGETSHIACPRCSGTGHIRSIESTALHVLRILQEEAMKENTAAIHAQVPVDVATYLLNEKRSEFHLIEQRLKVNCLLIPNIHLETPHYTLTRLRHDELNQNDITVPSYTLGEIPAEQAEPRSSGQKPETARTEAAVQGVTPSQPAPAAATAKPAASESPSILKMILGWFASPEEKPEEKRETPTRKERPARPRREERGNSSRRRDGKDQRERRPGRNAKSDSPASDQSDSQRDSSRQRKKSPDSANTGRREQSRRPSKEKTEAPAAAAIDQGANSAPPNGDGEARTGRRRRRRGRGAERRPEDNQTSRDETPTESGMPNHMPNGDASSNAEPTAAHKADTVDLSSAKQETVSPATSDAHVNGDQRANEVSNRSERVEIQEAQSEQVVDARMDSKPTDNLAVKNTDAGRIRVDSISTEKEQAESASAPKPETPSTGNPNKGTSTSVESSKSTESVQPSASEDTVSAPIPMTPKRAHVEIGPEEQTPPSTKGWKMDPIQLPSDMELVETQPAGPPVSEAPAQDLQPRAPRRRPARTRSEPPASESLVQIETQNKSETDSADNH